MHQGTLRLAALALASAIAVPACSTDNSGTPGPFAGRGAGRAASDITRSTVTSSGERLATGGNAAGAARATVTIIAIHQATERQKKVAAQRAKAVQAYIERQIVQGEKKAQKAKKQSAEEEDTIVRRKRKPRYIAVETVKEPGTTSPKAEKAVMIWDTQAQEIVGNSVYEIANPPPVGATSRFETYSAEYVGAGL